MVKFDKRKHKKAKWMTNGLLKSINKKRQIVQETHKNRYRRSPICHIKNEFTAFLRIRVVATSMKQSDYITCEYSPSIIMT